MLICFRLHSNCERCAWLYVKKGIAPPCLTLEVSTSIIIERELEREFYTVESCPDPSPNCPYCKYVLQCMNAFQYEQINKINE